MRLTMSLLAITGFLMKTVVIFCGFLCFFLHLIVICSFYLVKSRWHFLNLTLSSDSIWPEVVYSGVVVGLLVLHVLRSYNGSEKCIEKKKRVLSRETKMPSVVLAFWRKSLGSPMKHDNNIIMVWCRFYGRRRAVDYRERWRCTFWGYREGSYAVRLRYYFRRACSGPRHVANSRFGLSKFHGARRHGR